MSINGVKIRLAGIYTQLATTTRTATLAQAANMGSRPDRKTLPRRDSGRIFLRGRAIAPEGAHQGGETQ